MNKLITIIGAGPGISQSVAKQFGKQGFTVGLIARNEDKLKDLVKDLDAQNINAMYAVADVSKEESLKSALLKIKDTKGHADVILYNAAAVVVKDMLTLDWKEFNNTLQVNVGGAFNLLKTVLPYCLKENKGKLFFTNGGFALGGDPEWTTLSVGKAALRNLVQAAVKKAEDTNIHIAQLTICGFVNAEDEKYNPEAIAKQYWKLFLQEKGNFENEIMY